MNNKEQTARRLVDEARKGSPWSPRSIVYYILAVAYVLSPIDLIPDAILGYGLLDDTAVILAILFYIIRLRRKWKETR